MTKELNWREQMQAGEKEAGGLQPELSKNCPGCPEGKRKGIRKGKVNNSHFGSSGPETLN